MIKVLKLTTGEDIIADVEVSENTYTLKQSIRLLLTPEGGVVMMPYAPFLSTDTVDIKDELVVFSGEPEPKLKNSYNSKFGNGIVTAGAADLKIVT